MLTFAQNRKVILKVLCLTLCAIGCYWQLEIVTSKYFEYEVSTRVTLVDHELSTPPALATCYEHHLRNRKTTPHDIAQFTPSANDSYQTLLLITKSGRYVYGSRRKPIFNSDHFVQRHLSAYIVCYSYGFRSHLKIDNRLRKLEIILDVPKTLTNMSGHRFFNIIYDSNENKPPLLMPMYADWTFSNNKYIQIFLVYEKLVVELLRPPYVTNCVDYKSPSSRCRTLRQCIDRCLIEGTYKNSGHHPWSAFIDMTKNQSTTIENINSTAMRHCQNRYMAPECDQVLISRVKKKEITNDKVKPQVKIRVWPSSQPTMKVKSIPSINGIDFAIYVLSTVSFWLTLEPITIFTFSINWYEHRRTSSNQILQIVHELNSSDSKKLFRLLRQLKRVTTTTDLD